MTNRMTKKLATISLFVAAAFVLTAMSQPAAAADTDSPVGIWKTIDDNTNKAKSHVQIWENKGVLYGKVVKLLDPPEPNPLCDKCKGKRYNKPVIGMIILWGLKKDDPEWWKDGNIMDPDNGKTYGCKLKVTNGGKQLDVRGFVGFSLLGRTQTWHRVK